MNLTSSWRRSSVPLVPEDAWAVVADGREGPRWYVDAAPLVFRGRLDELLGGDGADAPPPGRDLLRPGDHVGFWDVTEADGACLELVARVRAPGTVTLRVEVDAAREQRHATVTTSVELAPRGLLGAAYLLADLPAREAVVLLTHRRLVGALRSEASTRER